MCKVLMMVLLERLKPQVEEHLAEEQAGFRRDRNTTQQILILRLLAEKVKRKGKKVYNCFIDFQKAFDSIKHSISWATMKSYGVGRRLTQMLQTIGENAQSAVRVGQELGEWFKTSVGTRQGDPLSPTTFITYLERVMDGIQNNDTGISVHGYRLNNLRFADDIDLIEERRPTLQANINNLHTAGVAAGLKINIGKTKTLVFGSEMIEERMKVGDKEIENVTEFEYLGSLLTWNNDCGKEIKRRIAKALGAMAGFKNIWTSKEISVGTKFRILRTCIFSILLYACESWTLRKQDRDKLLAFEMRCYRRILHIRWQQKITNKEVRRRARSKRNIIQIVMERKLKFFGHVCRMNSSRLIKQVVFGMVDGTGIQGRPSREWLDDIKEWCQMEIHAASMLAQSRCKWRQFVESVVNTYGH